MAKKSAAREFRDAESLEDALDGATLLSATGTVWIVIGADEINSAEYGRCSFGALTAAEFPMVDVGETLAALRPKRPEPPKPTLEQKLFAARHQVESAAEYSPLPWVADGFNRIEDAKGTSVIRTVAESDGRLIATAVNLLPKLLDFVDEIVGQHTSVGGLCAVCELETYPCDVRRAAEKVFS